MSLLSFLLAASWTTSVVYGDCNYGIYATLFPLAEGECSPGYAAGVNISYQLDCASNGNSATLKGYGGHDCSGDAVFEEDIDWFECDNDGDCDLVTLDFDSYNDAECDGSANVSIKWYLAKLTDACIDGVGISYTTSGSGITLEGFNYTNCSGDPFADITASDGCDNGTNLEFSASGTTGTSGSSSTEGDDDSQLSLFGNIIFVKFGLVMIMVTKLMDTFL